MKDNERTAVLDAARRLDAAAQKIGAAYRDLTAGLAEAHRATFHENGKEAVDDLTATIGNNRLEDEVAGLLVSVGLKDVMQVPRIRGVTPLADFYPRWKQRIEGLPTTSGRSHSRETHTHA